MGSVLNATWSPNAASMKKRFPSAKWVRWVERVIGLPPVRSAGRAATGQAASFAPGPRRQRVSPAPQYVVDEIERMLQRSHFLGEDVSLHPIPGERKE